MTDERIVTSGEIDDDRATDIALRPRSLIEFVGQPRVHEQLAINLEAARARGEPLDHILLSGPPGLGKTTLAQIVANEMGVRLRTTSGPAIEHQGMLASILTNLDAGDVFFIDEVHRLSRPVEEALYPAMEDYAFDYVAGKGTGAQTMRLQLPHFTVIGATTRPGTLGGPLRERFGISFRLDFYEVAELITIVLRSARLLGVDIDDRGATVIATCSRGTPRVANRLLRRARDYAQVRGEGHIDAPTARRALDILGVDDDGLDEIDRRVLGVLTGAYAGRPVGLHTLAVSVSEDPDTVEDVVEPYLIRLGFLARTPQGRLATAGAYRYLDLPVPVGVPGRAVGQAEDGFAEAPAQTSIPGVGQ